MNPVLTIDPEFEAKCPPLTEDELSQLEENILEEGLVLMPLIVWNDTIVDGHNRYRIAQAHPGIGFRTHEKQFNNRYEALSWICKNQLGRRNLTPQQKKYLIGQRYKAEKQIHGGDRKSEQAKSSSQNGNLISPLKTCDRIAEETNTSKSYVIRAEHFSDGIDAAEEVLPGIKNDLLLGKYKPRETDVAAIAKAAPEERREKAEHRPKDRELEQHRQTATHRTDSCPLVEIHLGLLLLESVLLLRILFVQFVNLRFYSLHLGRRRVRLVGERKDHDLYEYGHKQDYDSEVGDEPVQEVEQRDDHESGEPTHEPTSQRNDLLVLLVV